MATTTPPSPSALRALYRALLRELPPRPLLSRESSPLHQRLRDHFRPAVPPPPPPSSSSSTPPPPSASAPAPSPKFAREQHRAVAQAEQYVAYFRAQRSYAALLERYNPGMGMDEETRVRLTARRVGMDLPVEYEGKEE